MSNDRNPKDNDFLYDAFLSHNGADKEAVEWIARWLKDEKQAIVWLDKWELSPGDSWFDGIQNGLAASRTCAVFVGPQGFGPWHELEQREAIIRSVKSRKKITVIPVLLPGSEQPSADDLPWALLDKTWVKIQSLDPPDNDALELLLAGIQGRRPEYLYNEPVKAAEDKEQKIVPHGLRSFTSADSPFFLRLLPGPHTLDGLPVSVAFWKEHLEQVDPDRTFRTGLILGPSGCGKSSLVKAGLLPRLAEYVRAVYVEATPDDTEERLLAEIRKQTTGLPADLDLPATLAYLREHPLALGGCKLVLILDQFEQWLHAGAIAEDAPLLAALRHCDGSCLQAVLMVRTDFALEIHRFLSALDVRIREDENMRMIDLFDQTHARRVLWEYGRAYDNRLPDADLTDDQEKFLDAAVADLSDEKDRVVAVQLALVAFMLKDWSLRRLKTIGGAKGIGRRFLEENFDDAATAAPQNRAHRRAAMAVLRKLLPPRGSDLKGARQPRSVLQEVCAYQQRPKDFDELLHILQNDLGLISPSGIGEDDGQPNQPSFQLTHDYLVPSIRQWLAVHDRAARRRRNFFKAAACLVALILAVVIPKYTWDFCTFELQFASDPEFAETQRQEVVVTRKFNPFDYRQETFVFRDELATHEIGDRIAQRTFISHGLSPDWHLLAQLVSNERRVLADLEWTGDNLKSSEDLWYCEYDIVAMGKADAAVRGAIIGLLEDPYISVRSRTAETLGRFEGKDTSVTDALVAVLDDDGPEVRANAAKSLGQVGSSDRTIVGALFGLLRDSEIDVRQRAAHSLVQLSDRKKEVIQQLIGSHDVFVRFQVVESLGYTANTDIVPTLLMLCHDEHPGIRARAATSLGKIGADDTNVIDSLLTLLTNTGQSDVRAKAATALGELGKSDAHVINALGALFKTEDANSYVRYIAREALIQLGKRNATVIDPLISLLKDDRSDVRSDCATALGELGNNSAAIIDGLVALLKDQDLRVRWHAANSLGKLGSRDVCVVTGLLGLLQDEDSHLRSCAADALGRLGHSDGDVIEGLVVLLNDQDDYVRAKAAMALGRLGNGEASVNNVLIQLLLDKNADVRSAAAISIAHLGRSDAAVVDKLTPLLNDEDSFVRVTAANCLALLGQFDVVAIKSLFEMLDQGDNNCRVYAAETLVNFGLRDTTVFDGFCALLKHQDRFVRELAGDSLGQLGQKRDDWTDEQMLRDLEAFDSGVRRRAGLVLAWRDEKLDPKTAEKVRSLREDSRPWVRQAAFWALYHIEKRKLDREAEAKEKEKDAKTDERDE